MSNLAAKTASKNIQPKLIFDPFSSVRTMPTIKYAARKTYQAVEFTYEYPTPPSSPVQKKKEPTLESLNDFDLDIQISISPRTEQSEEPMEVVRQNYCSVKKSEQPANGIYSKTTNKRVITIEEYRKRNANKNNTK